MNPLTWVLHGGEDYELLMTISSKVWSRVASLALEKRIKLIPIGKVVSNKVRVQMLEIDNSSQLLKPQGWRHF